MSGWPDGLGDVMFHSNWQEGTIELEDEGDVDLEGWDLPPDLLNPGLPLSGGIGGDVPGARFIHQVQLHMPPCCASSAPPLTTFPMSIVCGLKSEGSSSVL